jgi:hypothetical protein
MMKSRRVRWGGYAQSMGWKSYAQGFGGKARRKETTKETKT